MRHLADLAVAVGIGVIGFALIQELWQPGFPPGVDTPLYLHLSWFTQEALQGSQTGWLDPYWYGGFRPFTTYPPVTYSLVGGLAALPGVGLAVAYKGVLLLAYVGTGVATMVLARELGSGRLWESLAGILVVLSHPLLERPGQLRATFAELQAKAASIQSGLLKVRGGLEDDNSPLAHSVDTALRASALLEELGEGMEELAGATEKAFAAGLFSREAGELLGEALPESRATIDSASQQLAQLNELLSPSEASEEPSILLTMMAGLLGSPTSPLQYEETLLRMSGDLVDMLIYSLGYDQPRTYLIVGQNDDEIRASGGFIGVVVKATVDRGELTGLRYFDSTTVDGPPYDINPPAPEPILRYLWISKLLFRDANWNPHFPSTSAQLADLYLRAQGVRVDGVLAATEEVILDLVDDYGGVRVPELPGLLGRDQAERYTEGELPYVCLPRHVSRRAKRCFDEDLFQAVIQRLTSPISEEERALVVKTLLERLSRKDILIHIFDETTSDFLLEQGWNGAMTQVDHDYLMVVDSAVPGHVRKVVERRLHYQVSLSVDGPSSAELLVEYRHKGTGTDPDCRQAVTKPTGCFWNYVRAYIPVLASDIQAPPIPVHEGSEWLIWGYTPADSLSVISSPRGGLPTLTEIGGYLTVEPGTTLTLPLR